MAMTPDQYQAQLMALLPRGAAWPSDPASQIGQLMLAFGDGLSRIDGRSENLLDEADPRTTTELLTDWERIAALPDACSASSATVQERRAALTARITNAGGQSRQYFIDLAASLGYTITLTEFRPHDCEHDCEYPVYDDAWVYAWQVNSALNTVRVQTCMDDCEMPLAVWGNALLECALGRVAPVHTTPLFAYQ